MENDVMQLIGASTPVLVGLVVMTLVGPLKKVPWYPDWLIPFAAAALGAVAYPSLEGWTALNFWIGVVAGGGAVAIDQTKKHYRERKEEVALAKQSASDEDLPHSSGTRVGVSRTDMTDRTDRLGLVLALVVSVAAMGCASPGRPATVPSSGGHVERMSSAISAAASWGVYKAVQADPNAQAYCEAAAFVIGLLIESGDLRPEALDQALSRISVRELRSEDARMGLDVALGLYQAYFGDSVAGNLAEAKPVLEALRVGVVRGLERGNPRE